MQVSTIHITFFSALLSAIMSAVLVPLILRLSHRFGWYDVMDYRKVHTEDVPRLGGVALFWGFFVCQLVLAFGLGIIPLSSPLLFLLVGFLFIHLLGLVDDFRNIPALGKLLGQIAAGVFVVIGGAQIRGIELPFASSALDFSIWAGPITVFWLISISNAINLIDGVDGLAGGISLIAAASMGIIHVVNGNVIGVLYSFTLVGAAAGFLVFNHPKARIFMGDSGSLFLGFALGSLLFLEDPGFAGIHLTSRAFLLPSITILLLPIFDTVASILRRIRQGRPIHSPDREHLHHKLLDFGFSVRYILLLECSITAISGAAAVFWAVSRISDRIPVVAGEIVMVCSWVFVGGFFVLVHFLNSRRKRLAEAE